MVMPVFLHDEELIGYTAIKGHWLDIGGKEPYSTDTVDVFQEGTIFPGVKLYSRGELVKDIYRMAIANSRVPKMVAGDINAEVVGVRTAAAALLRLVERYGLETFEQSVERMFDHGEAVVRSYFEKLPDGRYIGHGVMDNDGISDEPVPFEVTLEVDGSTVRVDFSAAPDARPGPVNCPIPSTVSASRIAISMLAGSGQSPNEGHFRPIEVIARPGSMFHPQAPSPCFLYGWPAMQAMEVIYEAVSKAMPEAVPACSGGDICALVWWGVRDDGRALGRRIAAPGRPGRVDPRRRGEQPHPPRRGRDALLADRGLGGEEPLAAREGRAGARLRRGRAGTAAASASTCSSTRARTCTSPPRSSGRRPRPGGSREVEAARANRAALRLPDGTRTFFGKATRLLVPKGATLELYNGGGGGYGPAAERDAAAVLDDVREGYFSEAFSRRHYPHAFE